MPKTHVSRRNTTIQRDLIRDIDNGLQCNPPFTDKDRAVKNALFSPTVCFVSGKKLKPSATGDHLYEVRNFYRITGRYGVDSLWNRIPVHKTKNTNYKVFEIQLDDKNDDDSKITRNVGYETLTEAEYKACTPQKRFIYDLIQQWKTYVGYRGAQLSFKLPEATTKRMNEVVCRALATIDEEAAAVVAEHKACATIQNGKEQIQERMREEDIVPEAGHDHASPGSTPPPQPKCLDHASPGSTPPPQPKCLDHASPGSSTPPPQPKCLVHASADPPLPRLPPLEDVFPPYHPIKWRIEKRERQSGKSKGKWDTYYHHVDTGKVCRSKREAREYQRYLQEQTTVAPPPRPTLVVPVEMTPPLPPSSRLMVSHQAVVAWVSAIVTQALAQVTSSPWVAARAIFVSTCRRRNAKRPSTSC